MPCFKVAVATAGINVKEQLVPLTEAEAVPLLDLRTVVLRHVLDVHAHAAAAVHRSDLVEPCHVCCDEPELLVALVRKAGVELEQCAFGQRISSDVSAK